MNAKITYHANYEGQEGYTVKVNGGDGWGLDSFYPLVRREGAREDEEKNFVPFSIINKIAELQAYGYKITFH